MSSRQILMDIGSWYVYGTLDEVDSLVMPILYTSWNRHTCVLLCNNKYLITTIGISDQLSYTTKDVTLICVTKIAKHSKNWLRN